jgi:hypothetical protein
VTIIVIAVNNRSIEIAPILAYMIGLATMLALSCGSHGAGHTAWSRNLC